MRRRLRSLAYVGLLACAACAGPTVDFPTPPADDIKAERRRQEIAQIRDYFEQLHRLDTVAFRIETANRVDCKERVIGYLGLLAVTPQSLPQKYRSFSGEALGVHWAHPTVVSVVDGSPAAAAGIVNGDQLLTINNDPLPATRSPQWITSFMKHNGDKPVTVAVRRDGEDRTLEVNPVMGCSIPVEIDINSTPNAFTNGESIVIQTGIMRLARTDDQLAVVVGHELAHVTLGHNRKRSLNEMVAATGGAMIDGGFLLGGIYTGRTFTNQFGRFGTLAYSVDFEREADYVGSYYAVRAGYSIVGAEELWQAVAMEAPDMIRTAKTHPTSPVRFLQMRRTAEEIANKQRHGLPLMPNEKKGIKVEGTTTAARAIY